MGERVALSIIVVLSCCYFFYVAPSSADEDSGTHTLIQGQVLWDSQNLTSANGNYTLKFFSSNSTKNKYLGIFTYPEDTVWVANRDDPVPGTSWSQLVITGNLLKIYYSGGNPIVVSSISSPTNSTLVDVSANVSATLSDDGNLVVRQVNQDGSINRTFWQSFDYPTNTLLPGMKLGINHKTGHRWNLTSWSDQEVPASGSFTLGLDPNGSSQLILWWLGNVQWTSGLWQTDHFEHFSLDGLKFRYITNENESYFTFSSNDTRSGIKLHSSESILTGSGYGYFGECSQTEGRGLGCVHGSWAGCRTVKHKFIGRHGFVDSNSYKFDEDMDRFDCRLKCELNCSCIAYASTNDNRTRCEIWTSDKTFRFVETIAAGSRDVYIFHRLRAPWQRWMWAVASAGGTILVLGFSLFCIMRRLRIRAAEKAFLQELVDATRTQEIANGREKEMSQVHLFRFKSIKIATKNFSAENKLGEGGFGSVYKGKLPGGQEVAIKRLSRNSGQGLVEFKNEILLIAKLQHNNLVRLLGCCIKGKEMILVYEYMRNKSLDFFIFDQSRRVLLKWADRMQIIEGVAQGLVYLHKHSRLRVIHRDLKASNILLDENMKPKISDFGMARIFEKHESEANTKRIVGTHGYMSPEYAMKGIVSAKADVFSYGVLVLEIVSGKRNHGCYHSERPLNLIGLAWELWIEGRAMEVIDTTLDCTDRVDEVTRTINIGLLCVQDSATDRPSMVDVVSMLANETLQLPVPKKPAYFTETAKPEANAENNVEKNCTNELSESVIEGR